jgi:hypothetical protein
LKIFYSSSPLKTVYIAEKNKNWTTLGILTSCKHKRELFIASRNSSNLDLINQYKRYCKILSALIKEAKKLHPADKIIKSLKKNKTICDTVSFETNKTGNTEKISTLNFDGNLTSYGQEVANAFNKFFLNIARSINTKQNEDISHNLDNTTPLTI